MARQHTRAPSFKSISRAALIGLGIFVLFGYLGGAAAQLNHILCTSAGEALGVLPSIAPVAWQAMQTYGFDHHPLECLLPMLLSLWPLLHVMAGGIQ
jgi:ABC-type nitrate/sulfonate/bicarbonate transport system permease component